MLSVADESVRGPHYVTVTAFFLCLRFALTLDLLFIFNLQRSNVTAGAGRGRGGARQRTAERIVEPCNVTAFFFVVGFLSLSILIFIYKSTAQ